MQHATEWATYLEGSAGLDRIRLTNDAVGRALQWAGSGALDTAQLLDALDLLQQARELHRQACFS